MNGCTALVMMARLIVSPFFGTRIFYMPLRSRGRLEYEISTIGIHWRKLDEDVSFESFTYDEAEPSAFQRFFLEHPEINIAEFSKAIGLNPSLMRNYINGFKKPSREREKLILDRIHELGKIYSEVSFYPQAYDSRTADTTESSRIR